MNDSSLATMPENVTPTVLVLICGPPASGKTNLAEALTKKLSHCVRLSFDDIFSMKEQESAVKTKGHLKTLRRLMLEGVMDILDGRRSTESATRIIDGLKLDEKNLGLWKYVLIDDNLYLRSMRYCWFQAVRGRKMSLCNVYMSTSLEECLRRNQQRNFPVRNNVIIEQFKKMEPPTSDGHEAEKFSFSVKNTSDASHENIIAMIRASQLCPFSPPESEAIEEKVQLSRETTRVSKRHNLDLAFRKAIAELLKAETCGEKKQQIWSASNSLKESIFSDPRLNGLGSRLETAAQSERDGILFELQAIITNALSEWCSLLST